MGKYPREPFYVPERTSIWDAIGDAFQVATSTKTARVFTFIAKVRVTVVVDPDTNSTMLLRDYFAAAHGNSDTTVGPCSMPPSGDEPSDVQDKSFAHTVTQARKSRLIGESIRPVRGTNETVFTVGPEDWALM